jgi:transcriptional regulator with XRE-family HTH domain
MPKFGGVVSNLLRMRRQQLNLRQRDIADALDVTADYICLVEAGERRLELDRIPELADVLQISRRFLCGWALKERSPYLFDQLFTGEEAPPTQEGSAA